MARESIIALDLEGTLVSNAVSQFPRAGLRDFLDFCYASFDVVCLYTAVSDELCGPILATMVAEENAPRQMLSIPLIQWDRSVKDLANIPSAEIHQCLIVDDNPDYIVPGQRSQWIPIDKFTPPYADSDVELARIQCVIAARLGLHPNGK
ncbi:NIF family HAD-type phosphatase [Lignipirellula cremea]|uniref:NLI interacting factor-like phosphatase n=1 Tax=Lignipirellula cremea TaxID=2528010 RepID=A0A518DPJ3_9BACT|nr:NIF family HAD-type phosphatase [Lignipirellula cremea]QDU93749.1 NLI interacting factor-like phosphatase [Lignipirellula cremea]